MISVLILTLNEEDNIADCINSVPWRDDVHVLDSGSTDGTLEIARQLGASTTHREFDGYASQRNAGFALPFKNDWIVMLDADERMTPELATEIEKKLAAADEDLVMFRVRRRDMFMGQWLRRSSGYPTWFPRIFRKGMVKVEREINEVYTPLGQAMQLQEHIDHYPFNKGINWWYDRHNRYSTREAQLIVQRSDEVDFSNIFKDPTARRACLKAIAYRLPMRPLLTFLYLYVARGGFLDGKAGWIYANMRLSYEIMINSKVSFIKDN